MPSIIPDSSEFWLLDRARSDLIDSLSDQATIYIFPPNIDPVRHCPDVVHRHVNVVLDETCPAFELSLILALFHRGALTVRFKRNGKAQTYRPEQFREVA